MYIRVYVLYIYTYNCTSKRRDARPMMVWCVLVGLAKRCREKGNNLPADFEWGFMYSSICAAVLLERALCERSGVARLVCRPVSAEQ